VIFKVNRRFPAYPGQSFSRISSAGNSSTATTTVAWWVHLLLVIIGMAVVPIVIGGTIAIIMALITRIARGHPEGSSHAFSWGAFISPVLAFFAAKYALELAASV
jgi:hypothetical protein